MDRLEGVPIREVLKHRDGLTIGRSERGTILQVATEDGTIGELKNEARILNQLKNMGIAPRLLGQSGRQTGDRLVSYTIETEDVTRHAVMGALASPDERHQKAIHFLAKLNASRVIHGDLTGPNLHIRPDSEIVALDWKEAIQRDELGLRQPKRPEPDSVHLFEALTSWGDPRRFLRRWVAIRRHLPYDLMDTFLSDFGCHYGFFSAAAAAEGAVVNAIDYDPSAILATRQLWKDIPFRNRPRWYEMDILQVMPGDERNLMYGKVALCLSTWAWMVKLQSRGLADAFMGHLSRRFELIFFETQLAGDGPGPEGFKTDDQVETYLRAFGCDVEPILTLGIEGRDAKRTVWKVTPKERHENKTLVD